MAKIELDFVKTGVLRYSLKYSNDVKAVIGTAIPMETKEEAVERIVADVRDERNTKKRKERLDILLDENNANNLENTLSGIEEQDVIKAAKDTLAVEKAKTDVLFKRYCENADFKNIAATPEKTKEKSEEEKHREKLLKEVQRGEYIDRLNESRVAITREAFDAGFKSLMDYLLFLNIIETHRIYNNDSAPILSFDYRNKNI